MRYKKREIREKVKSELLTAKKSGTVIKISIILQRITG